MECSVYLVSLVQANVFLICWGAFETPLTCCASLSHHACAATSFEGAVQPTMLSVSRHAKFIDVLWRNCWSRQALGRNCWIVPTPFFATPLSCQLCTAAGHALTLSKILPPAQ